MITLVCLFGGGRWARVLLSVLLDNYPDLRVIWVTKNGYADNVHWLKRQNIKNVLITSEENQAWDLCPQAVIVASLSSTHSKYIKQAISFGIPVLSEKPFSLSVSEAQELITLSNLNKVAVGVNFEFMYASYLQDFARYLKNTEISSLDVIWQDPFCETRHGEKKIGDIYTPLMHDSFQHCWSLLYFLFPDETLDITFVAYHEENSVAVVEAVLGTKTINICLSRRASQRIRKIVVNEGSIVLDFAREPGTLLVGQKEIQNQWKDNRPLFSVFNSFFKVIQDPQLLQGWPLNIGNCFAVIGLSVRATELLEQAQKGCIEKRYPLSAEDRITRNLLVDLFLPKLTALGEYHHASNLEEQLAFSNHVIRRLSLIS
ncbi:Gfo/Idh/MocA family oxidoreductase [Legionella cincinnatiensis]|uniref:Oxidoreductase n=1 Tax=Legionella cincinnatiensis TaxID=28085 RepID=A0A378IF88_9GAMM|nr:Gfo/Idh/MocA family oxidoreductase [Legionella cincinnatiensis]KTC92051.1 oxidoreductase [Legionella cincinnatiensis]STX33646.1 oxidoreductase [Legionella cincinnatiensis]